MFLLGLMVILFACAMDTSVSTGISGDRVHNVGLMRDQSNAIFIGVAMLIGGVVTLVFAGRGASGQKHKLIDSGVTGGFLQESDWNKDRDLSDDGYKLYLSRKFKIEKNHTFDKFVLEEKMYDDIEVVLRAAHEKDVGCSENRRSSKFEGSIFSDSPSMIGSALKAGQKKDVDQK